jgi:hypothetical protein
VIVIGAVAACVRQTVDVGDAHRLPEPQQIVLPVPASVTAAPDEITEIAMRNVAFHVDDDIRLEIRQLRGRMRAVDGTQIVTFDDKTKVAIDVASGEIALTPGALSLILNRYVFGYKGSPLKNLVVRTEGNQIVQTGTMHKLIDIPFEMTATLSVNDDGWIRIHPTRIDICNLDGQKLLKAVGSSLEDLLDLSGGKGAKVVGNDLLLNPMESLPPPALTGKITSIRVEGGKIIQTFGSPAARAEPVTTPVAAANYIYFHGGKIKFGKLYMVESDLMTVDGDTSDPFDFYMDYYHSQLVAGYHITLANYGLVTYMPDFDDLGTARGRIIAAPVAAGQSGR